MLTAPAALFQASCALERPPGIRQAEIPTRVPGWWVVALFATTAGLSPDPPHSKLPIDQDRFARGPSDDRLRPVHGLTGGRAGQAEFPKGPSVGGSRMLAGRSRSGLASARVDLSGV